MHVSCMQQRLRGKKKQTLYYFRDSFSEEDSIDDPCYMFPRNISRNLSDSDERESETNIKKQPTFDWNKQIINAKKRTICRGHNKL